MQELLDSVKSLSGKQRKALAALLKKQKVNLYGVTPIFKREPDEQPLLSYAQQRQWLLWQLEPESSAYNIATALSFNGILDLEALQHSFQALIARHETLRTTFEMDGEKPIQVIHPDLPFSIDVERLESAEDSLVQARVEQEMARPFDLLNGPLLRVRLLQRSIEEHVLVLTLHHIVSDGWSMPIMVDELVQLYVGYSRGQAASLPDMPIQYADYAIWQRHWMEAGEQERQLAYWQAQLGGEQPVLELPLDHSRPVVRSYTGDNLGIELPTDLVRALKQLAQGQGVTLFMLLLASFQMLLQRYSGQNDIRVGVPIANRTRVETEQLIGFFVNTQVLKAEFDLHLSFNDLLQQVRQTVLDAQAHQDLPFQQLVEALHPERSLSHNPLFQVMYNHQTQVKGKGIALPGLELQPLEYDNHTAQFDLSLDTFESETGLWASLTFATELFDRQTIERMGRHWVNLLQGVVRQPQQRIVEVQLLDTAEYQQIVHDWNRTEASYPSELCIHQLIEQQVERTPQAPALMFGEQSLSYAELNQQANRLANKLRELGVGPDVLVGLAVERSLEMVVGLLAILKAGGAYVPLDPEYPQDRLAYMVEDSGIRLLLTQAHVQGQLPVLEGGVQTVILEAGPDWLADYSDANPVNLTRPENLAYVIYTSGSTGKPKGTLLPHHNVLRLFQATDENFHF
ncbi:condensation domain-containing protein, partial [Pseudomonas sp. 3A(2025)]